MNIVRALVAVILFVALAVGYRIVTRSGMLTRIEPHFAGTCRVVAGVVGAEDVTIDPDTRVAYLSAQDRRALRGPQGPRGEIYLLPLDDEHAAPMPLTGGQPLDFHPHGISLWRGEDGLRRLFVINHRSDGSHTVEVFDVGATRLTHVRTVRYSELVSPNDLVAVDGERFYATNDRGVPEPGWRQTLELYLALPWSTVSYFDGRQGHFAARGLAMANGIARSADGHTIYVAECLGHAVHVYARHPMSGELRERQRISLPACPDNIEVDEHGKLWIATHPRLFDLVGHAQDPNKRAPSQVFRLDPQNGRTEEVYLSGGDPLSAASTAAVLGRTMVLGAIFDPHVLVCSLP